MVRNGLTRLYRYLTMGCIRGWLGALDRFRLRGPGLLTSKTQTPINPTNVVSMVCSPGFRVLDLSEGFRIQNKVPGTQP